GHARAVRAVPRGALGRGGCRNGRQLWRELQERGYPGSRKLVARWAQRHRTAPAPTTPTKYLRAAAARPLRPAPAPSPRRVACRMVARPEGLAADARAVLEGVRVRSAVAAAAHDLAQRLAAIVRDRTPTALDGWLTDAEASGVPDLRTFARGLRRDEA